MITNGMAAMRFRSRFGLSLFLAAAIFGTTFISGSAQSQKVSEKQLAASAKNRPYSFDELVGLVKDSSRPNPVIPIRGVIKAVRRRGVDFTLTAERLDRLKKEGAPDELLQLLVQLVGAPSGPAVRVEPSGKPTPKEGRLTVFCKPVDCIVTIDGKERGLTVKSELKDILLPEGAITISAVAKNYVPDKRSQVVTIQDNGSAQAVFSFSLDPAALLDKGNALFSAMIAALGGEAALKDAASFNASGRLEIHDHDNKVSTWPFVAVVNYPSKVQFIITKNNRRYEVTRKDAGFVWKPKVRGDEMNDVEEGLLRLLDYHIAKLVDMIRGTGLNLQSEKLIFEPGEDVAFKVSREAYKYRVALNADSRPKEIVQEAGGLNAGLKVLLSDYVQQGAGFVPREVDVQLPGTGMRGLFVHYESFSVIQSGSK